MKHFKVVLERKVTYVAMLEVTADNFEDAKLKAISIADVGRQGERSSWREMHSETVLKNILQED